MKRDELSFLSNQTDADTLGALVMDLGAQLHVERQARLALQEALVRQGAVSAEAIDALADDADFLARARAELDRSMARIMRIMVEAGDKMGPLRDEAPDAQG
ncbi:MULTISPECIES: hypothetical protein [unclassified Roseitalea]|uniref:hypothetical protein n=1 Tax=unclassified Roseitalea TaxID=2639107 RepID=UPI00273DB986|nr:MULTISPECIES: hypothetical protein [unclassified Roseitalea]